MSELVDFLSPSIMASDVDSPQKFSTPADNDDVRLFERFLEGDNAAFAELFDRHNQRLFTYCMKIVGSAAQSEDLTQEIWERVLRLRSKPQTILNPIGFLLRIARNLCINQLKAAKRNTALDDLCESAQPIYRPREQSEMEELVPQLLPKLSFEFREVLILTSYCGYEYTEIAEMLGKSIDAVRMRTSRARAQLRGLLMEAMNKETRRVNGSFSTLNPGGVA